MSQTSTNQGPQDVPRSRLDALGALLAELDIVSPKHWASALSRAAHSNDLGAVTELLCRARAHWAPASAPTAALTEYQCKQIFKCTQDPTFDRLTRLLRWCDYLLLDALGRGGMGVVYKAWDLSNHRYVAIKRSHRNSAEIRRRLRREANLQRSLEHPNIARLFGLEKWRKADLLVLEYLPGSTLAELVKQRGGARPLPWRSVAEWAVALLDALDYAHGNNASGKCIIHRDIKPGNVMLLKTPERYVPKLLDLGLAKSIGAGADATAGEHLTGRYQVLGTPEYMAPEMWDGGHAARPASDIYSLGCTLYFALTGRPPFGSVASIQDFPVLCMRHSEDARPSVAAVRTDVPATLNALLRQMLAVEQTERGEAGWLRDEALARCWVRLPRQPLPPPSRFHQRPSGSGSRGAERSAPAEVAEPSAPPSVSAPATLPPRVRPAPPRTPRPVDLLPPLPVEPFPGTGTLVYSFIALVSVLLTAMASARGGDGPSASDSDVDNEVGRWWIVFRSSLVGWLRSLVRPHLNPIRCLVVLLLLVGLGYAAGPVAGCVAGGLLLAVILLCEFQP